jgi:predicted metal-binding protein
VGFSAGLVEVFSTQERKASAFDVFTDVIGYTTLGTATGLVYPITFPAMMKQVIMN